MITQLDQVTEFPLCWPEGKPRAAERRGSPFRTSLAKAHQEIRYEMERWQARGHVISMAPSYRQGPVDPGVALWWAMRPVSAIGRPQARSDLRVLACDNYERREANLHAIALTLEGLRSFERYGTYSLAQAVEGARPALPPPASAAAPEGPWWWEVLGVKRDWPLDAIIAVYKSRAEKAHPDHGGEPGEMAALSLAIAAARAELGGAGG